MSEEELREQIKRQLGESYEMEEKSREASGNVIQMPVDGSIILTKEAAEKLSKILDKKLKRNYSHG
jgi:uncharacterized protein (UPF0218 family)